MSEQQAANVVTSENSADFYAQRLGLAVQDQTEAEESEPVKSQDASEPNEQKEAATDETKEPEKRSEEHTLNSSHITLSRMPSSA